MNVLFRTSIEEIIFCAKIGFFTRFTHMKQKQTSTKTLLIKTSFQCKKLNECGFWENM